MVKIIAEAGTCNGNEAWAHDAVEEAARAGVWGFKVQLLQPDTIAAADSPRYDRLRGPETQRIAFRNQLPYTAWAEIFAHARDRGLEPFASCWDEAAVEACEQLGVAWYKIGSADITHHTLLRLIRSTGKHVLWSTGAATTGEVLEAAEILGGVPMACTLSYPCEPDDARIERVHWLRDLGFDVVGYSDHTTGVATGGYAVAAGAVFLEKHFTITPGRGGDHDFALDPGGLEVYRLHAEQAWGMTHSPVDVGEPLPAELPARRLARRSLHATADIGVGETVVVGVNAAWLRPGGGVDPRSVGPWRAARVIVAGERIDEASVRW